MNLLGARRNGDVLLWPCLERNLRSTASADYMCVFSVDGRRKKIDRLLRQAIVNLRVRRYFVGSFSCSLHLMLYMVLWLTDVSVMSEPNDLNPGLWISRSRDSLLNIIRYYLNTLWKIKTKICARMKYIACQHYNVWSQNWILHYLMNARCLGVKSFEYWVRTCCFDDYDFSFFICYSAKGMEIIIVVDIHISNIYSHIRKEPSSFHISSFSHIIV